MKKRKKRTVVVAKRAIRVPRTRNAGTFTESEYFSRIRSALRNAFKYWKPMMLALEAASRPYKGPNKLQKKEYQCAHCKKWFMRKKVEIDHIEECGSLQCYDDIVPFIKRLTKESEKDYAILCKPCHKTKTDAYLLRKKKAKKVI